MKAIIDSENSFLVNTFGSKAHIGNQILKIDTQEKEPPLALTTSGKIPVYEMLTEEDWANAAQKLPIIELASRPELEVLYNQIHNDYEDQFESREDFIFNHQTFPQE